jgi:hypothetical protein
VGDNPADWLPIFQQQHGKPKLNQWYDFRVRENNIKH